MHLVIDSSAMRRDELRNFLKKSPENRAVLTDYAAMEAYSGDSLSKIFSSMAVVSDFPGQIIVLKNTSKAAHLHGKAKGLRRRLIDQHQTKGFRKYVADLRIAKAGSPPHERALLKMGQEASDRLADLQDRTARFGEAVKDFAKLFTGDEIKVLRRGEDFPQTAFEKLVKFSMTIAANMFAGPLEKNQLPPLQELPNMVPFRLALAGTVMMMMWVEKGGYDTAPVARFRNDLVDSSFAAYGTYFDGLMTFDNRLEKIYQTTQVFVELSQRGMSGPE